MTDATPEERAAARDYLIERLAPNLDELRQALYDIYGDSYEAGKLAAAQQTGFTAGLGDYTVPTDWTKFWADWKPGNPAAASLLDDGGFRQLLDRADVTVQGVSDSLLDRLGTVLADGVKSGDSVDSIARALGDIVTEPVRAQMIATTETARAVTVASINGYQAAGIGQFDLLISPDACPQCEDAADANPHDVSDSDAEPPLHPNCRCAAAPVAGSLAA